MNKLIIIALLFLYALQLQAQGEIDEQRESFIDNDNTVAISVKTNGFAADYHYGKYINAYKKRIYEVDLSIIKHQKEYKKAFAYSFQSRFAYGKKNFVFALRGGTGRTIERFSKLDKGSVSINTFHVFGPSLAFIKPIYYSLIDSYNYSYTAKIGDRNFSYNNVDGKASFLKGFNELSLSPGIYIKYGVNFDYSKEADLRRAIEAGIMFEGYLFDLPIMDMTYNPRIFGVLFFSYRFGSVIQ